MLYPLNFPSSAPQTERLVLNHRQAAMESPFTYATQVVHTASQWMLEWSWPQMPHAEAQSIAAWLTSLRGQVGTFTYAPRNAVAASITGISLASAGNAYANTVLAKGWAANTASGLRLGQWMQIGDQLLKIISAGTTADAQGRVAIEFEPLLRITVAANTAVNLATPRGLFRLATSETPSFTLDPDRRPSFGTIQAREVVA